MASDLAFHLASRGWEVEAITSRQRYDDARADLQSEAAHGVHITRIWSTRFGRAGLVGRAIDYATFYASAFFALLRRRDAIVVAMTDPPLLSLVAAVASRRVVNWVQDLFPEVAQSLGIRVPRFVRVVRDWSLRRARANVVLGELMAARVPKAMVIHNWADAALEPRPRAAGNPFTVIYSGNLGRAHEVDTILGAIRLLPDVPFVFIGGGARMGEVRREMAAGPDARRQAGETPVPLAHVELRPYVPRERLSESLSSADVHLVSLQPALEGLIVPSKFYGVLAAGRPVLFIGARDGELARIIDEHRCGIAIEAGDAAGLAREIQRLAANRDEAEAMGRRGRELYVSRFASPLAFAAWEQLLESVGA